MNEKSNIELKEFCSAAPERLNLFVCQNSLIELQLYNHRSWIIEVELFYLHLYSCDHYQFIIKWNDLAYIIT